MQRITVIGGGLAGSEAAWQAAQIGIDVNLYEMRPHSQTGAHTGDKLAELVCSNSLGSNLVDRASGLLKEELRRLDSLLLSCAEATALPAGGALAVDREAFASLVTERIQSHARIHVIREAVTEIPDGTTVIASGPLTSPDLARAIGVLTGEAQMYFYDAIAPIVTQDSIDMSVAFRASRYTRGEQSDGDYINCPFSRDQYEGFVSELAKAEKIQLRPFETDIPGGVRAGASEYFEGCLPVEVLAGREPKALAFGPMRPIGLTDPSTGCRPYAVLQLRQDNLSGSLYNLVGFQTNLKFSEQKRVFSLIPGLERAEFVRFGQMHRNTYIASPLLLESTLQLSKRKELFFAGQITGVEGYMGNIATGWLAGQNAARTLLGAPALALPKTTMLGALVDYITHAAIKDFQPMKANYGILPPLEMSQKMGKRERAAAASQRSLADLEQYWRGQGFSSTSRGE